VNVPDDDKKEPEEPPKPQDADKPEKLPEMGQPEFKGGEDDIKTKTRKLDD
jgi:hypothetical protein